MTFSTSKSNEKLFANIPNELRNLRQWVNWNLENGTKPPYHPNGFKARKTNSQDYSDFETVVKHVGKYTGIGFCFTPDDHYNGGDIDGCRNPETGELTEWGKFIVKRFATYCEISPSGTGLKIVWKGEPAFDVGRKLKIDVENEFGKSPAFEVYSSGAYFTLTGAVFKGYETIKTVAPEKGKIRSSSTAGEK